MVGAWAGLEQTDGVFLTTPPPKKKKPVTRKGAVSDRNGNQADSVRDRA